MELYLFGGPRNMHVWHIWINLFASKLAYFSCLSSEYCQHFDTNLCPTYFLLPARTKNGIRDITHHRNVSRQQRHKQREKKSCSTISIMVWWCSCGHARCIPMCIYVYAMREIVRRMCERKFHVCHLVGARRRTSRIGPLLRECSATEYGSNFNRNQWTSDEHFWVKTKPVLCLIACTRPH